MNWQDELQRYMADNFGVNLSEKNQEDIRRIILEGHEGTIFRSEMKKVRETRIECAIAAKMCIDASYPFPNEEVAKEMVEQAILNESRTPNLTDSVRFILTH